MIHRILFVSDGPLDQSLRTTLEAGRFEVAESDPEAALARLRDGGFSLLAINLRNAEQGVGLLRAVRANADLRNLSTLVIAEWGTGQPTVSLAEGAEAFERAPIDTPRLIAAVERLLRPRMVMTARASATNGEGG